MAEEQYEANDAWIAAQSSRGGGTDRVTTGGNGRSPFLQLHRKDLHNSTRTAPSAAALRARAFSASARIYASVASPYDALQLPRTATRADIKSRYYDLVKELHPDRAGNASEPSAQRTERFHQVVRAYELLHDPKQRALYDRYQMGWDSPEILVRDRAGRQQWGPRRTYRPRSQDEWQAWDMWSDVLRQAAARGNSYQWRDHTGGRWSSAYDGFPEQLSPEEAKRRAAEAMPSNRRYFALIFFLGWAAAAYQFHRINIRSGEHFEMSQRKSAEVAQSLNEARAFARSSEGQMRRKAMLERARQNKSSEPLFEPDAAVQEPLALPAPTFSATA